ncbi:hypothetical protein YA0783_00565 [Pseudomonas corrugata]|uniref:hypothetical protein n=1 Tax=Pseudomonas corrugata TaxID=47879 RepID=UPI0018E5ABC2|nr:hypothetical protein [Pseudomonas corrugata]MBI6616776.1 hypothetical protein [Pseudomonas corrugata]MBI6694484.1 hypothetical protein [Pseudomonas corrugata]
MKISEQHPEASGWMKGSVGGVEFEVLEDLTLIADDGGTDFVVQADWTSNSNNGGARQLTFYFPPGGPGVYTLDSLAKAFYEIEGKLEPWQRGYITRKSTDFSSPDHNHWCAEIEFKFDVSIDGLAIQINGTGSLRGASPWSKRESSVFRRRRGIGTA